MNWTEDSFTLQENCIVTLESAGRRGRLPARLRGSLEPPAAPRQERPLRRRVVGRELRRAARARAAVLLPRPRARARGADRQPHLVRARARADLLARAHLRPDPGRALRCRRARRRAGHRASSIARRCRTCCGQWGGACRRRRGSRRRSASSPRKAHFGGKRSIPWGPGDRARLPARQAGRVRRLGVRRLLQPLARGRGERRERARDRRQGRAPTA